MKDIYEKEKLKFLKELEDLVTKHISYTDKSIKAFYDVQEKVADKKCFYLVSELIDDDLVDRDTMEISSKANASEITKFNEYKICKEKAVQNSLKLESHHMDDFSRLNNDLEEIVNNCIIENRREHLDINKLHECFEDGKREVIFQLKHISGLVKDMEFETEKLKKLL
jgi:hypothetical protein